MDTSAAFFKVMKHINDAAVAKSDGNAEAIVGKLKAMFNMLPPRYMNLETDLIIIKTFPELKEALIQEVERLEEPKISEEEAEKSAEVERLEEPKISEEEAEKSAEVEKSEELKVSEEEAEKSAEVERTRVTNEIKKTRPKPARI